MPDDITNFPKKGDDKKVSLRNSNFPQFDYAFAVSIKENYPNIWDEGGNIRGNEAFEYWGKARAGDETEGVLDWIKEREAWMARHEKDKLIAGVVAVMKWGGIVTRGEKYMKDLINNEKDGDKSMDKIKKVLGFEVKQVGSEEDRTLRFVGSDESIDRDSDIIEVAGWKLDDYLKNPVFLWAHDYSQPPCGKAVNVTIDAVAKKLLFDIKFPTAEEYPFGDTIYKLYRGGYLRATSVGFRGTKFKTRDDDEVLELPEWRRGKRFMEQHLLELSAVPVPSNPNALMQARSAGIDTGIVEKAFEQKEVEYIEDKGIIKLYDVEKQIEKTFTVEFLKDIDIPNYNAYKTHSESIAKLAQFMSESTEAEPGADCVDEAIKIISEKAGATLSKKTKEMLTKICEEMSGCESKLRKFIEGAAMEEPMEPMMTADMTADMTASMTMMPMMEPMMSAMRTLIATELKQALEGLSFMPKTDATKAAEIDLDAIELPKAPTDAAQVELNIEPEALKNMIAELLAQQLKGGSQS